MTHDSVAPRSPRIVVPLKHLLVLSGAGGYYCAGMFTLPESADRSAIDGVVPFRVESAFWYAYKQRDEQKTNHSVVASSSSVLWGSAKAWLHSKSLEAR